METECWRLVRECGLAVLVREYKLAVLVRSECVMYGNGVLVVSVEQVRSAVCGVGAE